MMNVLTKSLCLMTALVAFSSCNKGGDSGGGGQAAVPTVGGVQNNTIYDKNDQNTYCSISGGSLICHSRVLQMNNTFTECKSSSLTYTNLNTLCSQLNIMQSNQTMAFGSQCNYSMAATLAYNSYCGGDLNQNGTLIDPRTLNSMNIPNLSVVQCDYEAYRSNGRRWFPTPKLNTQISLNRTMGQSFNISQRFLNFGNSNFGTTTLDYRPSGIKGTADTITLTNKGLEKMTISQSGFAGQPVKLEVMSDDGMMRLAISCSTTGSTFRKNVASRAFTQYLCRGTSSLYGSTLEQIDVSFPYNTSLMNSELNLAKNLTATVTGDGRGGDNARITFTASGVGFGISLQSSAYLKTTTQLNGTDGFTTLNLTCGPQ